MHEFVPITNIRPSLAMWRSVGTHTSLLSHVGATYTSTPCAYIAARARGM